MSSSAEMDFPSSLTFDISASSDANITGIRLHYRVDRDEFARITSEVYIAFEPVKSVTEQWVWDMRMIGGLPPGSSVTYWWTVADAKGNSLKTNDERILIEDNRYQWQSLTHGHVTLYWYKGDDAFAANLMNAAQQALSRLAAGTGAELQRPVKIYIYASAADLQGSMVYAQEWTGGVAFSQYGIIAIGIAPSNLAWGTRAIAHELTHLVIHQVTFNPYSGLPIWLDEGLAMNAEGELESEFINALHNAVENNNLITVQSLSSPFSAFSNEATLDYAESYSVIAYLIENYGQDKMFELLNTFRQGTDYDEALKRVYGFDMRGLYVRWRDSLVTET